MLKAVTDRFFVAGQLPPAALTDAAQRGVTTVINNRPDGEAADQPSSDEMAKAAAALGLAYHHIPVTAQGISQAMLDETNQVLTDAPGNVLAFCRSGTRSITLWAFARATAGEDPDSLVDAAAAAGYDLSPMARQLAQLAGKG